MLHRESCVIHFEFVCSVPRPSESNFLIGRADRERTLFGHCILSCDVVRTHMSLLAHAIALEGELNFSLSALPIKKLDFLALIGFYKYIFLLPLIDFRNIDSELEYFVLAHCLHLSFDRFGWRDRANTTLSDCCFVGACSIRSRPRNGNHYSF